MTREGRRNPLELKDADGYRNLFASLFKTSARVDGLKSGNFADENVKEGLDSAYILGVLYNYGGICYDPETGAWAPYSGTGQQTLYGRRANVVLFGANGRNFVRNSADVYIFKANPAETPLCSIVARRAELLAEFDAAIRQNLDAVKDMTVIYTENEELAGKLKNADSKRRAGASVAVLSTTQKDFGEIGTLSTGAEYKVGELLRDRRKIYEETLHLVGVRTPIEKGERMITGEVDTQNAETDAYIGIMERTFNDAAELYGVPFRLVVNAVPVDVVGEEV